MTSSDQHDAPLWPEFIIVGNILNPPGGTFGPRIQFSIEVVMIHSGEMTAWVDGKRHYAPAGTVSIFFPGHEEWFEFARESETQHSFLHIGLPDIPESVNNRLRNLPWPLPLSPEMVELTNSALALRSAPLSTSEALLKAVAVQILWLYIGEGEKLLAGKTATSPHPAVERAEHHIQTHLGDPLTLEILARAAAVSPSHLIRLFQSELDTTPIAYLWQRRVGMGIELLKNTGLSVGMIAQRCGFQTSYHFSRRVRQATGLSPLEVRRRAWQGP